MPGDFEHGLKTQEKIPEALTRRAVPNALGRRPLLPGCANEGWFDAILVQREASARDSHDGIRRPLRRAVEFGTAEALPLF